MQEFVKPHIRRKTKKYENQFGLRTKGKGKLGTYAMKRVAAGAHLPTPWLFEPAKRPDDRADYYLGCSFLPWCKHQVFALEWRGI